MTRGEIFDKLGCSSDVELLEHLPVRYDPMTPTPEREQAFLSDGERVRLRVQIDDVKPNLKAGIILFSGRGMATGKLYTFMVYRQMFYLNRIAKERRILVVGNYSSKRKRIMVRGIYELDSPFVKAGVKPVYRLPKEVSPSVFESQLKRILNSDSMLYVKDVLPKKIRNRYRLVNRAEAFRRVHFPRDEKDLEGGLRVFRYEECLSYCTNSRANRMYLSALKKGDYREVDISELNALVKKLPFKLTEDQVRAVRETVGDMNSGRVMFRLLEGDVGTGKTVVALFALYANYLRGGQGILVAPTLALAQQHYETACSLLEQVGMRVGFLSSGMRVSQRREVLQGISRGNIDVLVTTQAGSGKEVEFARLTLAVIDEQQNFGVNQRAELISKGGAVDTLMMTATPIPRTLARVESGDMDITELRHFPGGAPRRVDTRVCTSDDKLLDSAVNQALRANRQVFVVVPRIEETSIVSDEMGEKVSAKEVYAEYCERYGADRVQLLHGRMKAADQERILAAFKDGSRPILVSTSVIEVGMDIQSAGLMIVYSANLFGMSALHQMRGRIGRNGKFALAIFVYDGSEEDSRSRLEYLASTDDGFSIAQYDAQHRGIGSISGFNQSGSSSLAVADFVGQTAMLECAVKDAEEILDGISSDPEYSDYARAVIGEEGIKDAILG